MEQTVDDTNVRLELPSRFNHHKIHDKIKANKLGYVFGTLGGIKNAYAITGCNFEGKTYLGKPT